MPRVVDVLTMGKLLGMLGIAVTHEGDHTVVQAHTVASTEAPYDLVRTMRASVLVLGPLVARLGEAKVSLPGGCAIGSRPVNFHLAGLEKMGATVEIDHGYIKATARRLKGCRIYFDTPSVTGTENLMMAAVLAEGTTVARKCSERTGDLRPGGLPRQAWGTYRRGGNRYDYDRGRDGAARSGS